MKNDTAWWLDAKMYELYVDKFAGDFKTLTNHLSYFNALGVNTLHILPHYPSPMVDQGYDITDFRGVRPELGTLDDFHAMIRTAHAHGLRVIVDFVVNHVSDQHPWFREAQSSRDNPKREYFLWSATQERFAQGTNAFPDIKPNNWIWNEATQDFYYATFYPQQPDINWDNEEVVQTMFGHIDFLAGLGVDGFRIDAAQHIVKRDGTDCKGLPETHAIFKRMRAHLEERYPGVILLAEAGAPTHEIKKYFGNGDEFHMAYHFPLADALWCALLFNDQARLRDALEQSKGIPDVCQWVTFLRNHDDVDVRGLGHELTQRVIEGIDPARLYVFNHGSTTSIRLATAFQSDRKKILEAFMLLYSLPGAPVCYYGDEIGMTNTPRDLSVVDTRVCVRGQFDWNTVREQMSDPDSLLRAVSSCIATQNIKSGKQ